jgi:hypothetical protein
LGYCEFLPKFDMFAKLFIAKGFIFGCDKVFDIIDKKFSVFPKIIATSLFVVTCENVSILNYNKILPNKSILLNNKNHKLTLDY